jgi:DUF4097 and DUF4098 domain-containing protein YvlB
MQLVQDGKLSPEDAAELIDAFNSSDEEMDSDTGQTPPPPPSDEAKASTEKDPFKNFIGYVEGIGKEVSESVNWQDVARQVRTGAQKGFESLKEGIEKVKKEGKFNFDIFSAKEIRTIEMPVSLAAGQTLKIENPIGDIRIHGGHDSGLIKAVAKVHGINEEEAKIRAAEYTLVIEESDHMVIIRQPDSSGIHVDIDVAIPLGVHVDARTWSGDLIASEIEGNCKTTASSGNIRVAGVKGAVEISSQSGSVIVDNVTTPTLSLENKSGNVSMAKVAGNMNVRTASGDLALSECSGKSISVESVSGDVSVDLVEPITGSTSIRTVNGSTTLAVPDGCDCRVTLSTLRGHVTCPLELEDASTSDMHVSGRLGDGTGTLDVSAVNGSILMNLRVHS